MQLAVISDIHGNCYALDRVLHDIRQQGIEQHANLHHALRLAMGMAPGIMPCDMLRVRTRNIRLDERRIGVRRIGAGSSGRF